MRSSTTRKLVWPDSTTFTNVVEERLETGKLTPGENNRITAAPAIPSALPPLVPDFRFCLGSSIQPRLIQLEPAQEMMKVAPV